MRIAPGREHEDGRAGARANPSEHIEPAEARHHHVQHDERIRAGYCLLDPVPAIDGTFDVEPLAPQEPCDERAQLRIVIDDQNAIHQRPIVGVAMSPRSSRSVNALHSS